MIDIRNETERAIQNLALLSSSKKETRLDVPNLSTIEITVSDTLESLKEKILCHRNEIAPAEIHTVFLVAIAMVDLKHYKSIYIIANNLPVCELVSNNFGINTGIIVDLYKFKEIYLDIQKRYGPRPLPRL